MPSGFKATRQKDLSISAYLWNIIGEGKALSYSYHGVSPEYGDILSRGWSVITLVAFPNATPPSPGSNLGSSPGSSVDGGKRSYRLVEKCYDPWLKYHVDAYTLEEAEALAGQEIAAFTGLAHLQGSIIPYFYAPGWKRNKQFDLVPILLIEYISNAKRLDTFLDDLSQRRKSNDSGYREETIAEVMEKAKQGLEAIHESGWSHGDVRPQYLLLVGNPDKEGSLDPVWTDFGRSCEADEITKAKDWRAFNKMWEVRYDPRDEGQAE